MELNEEELKRIKVDARERHIPILLDDSMELIEKLIKETNSKTLLELGTAVGYSSMMFAKFMGDGSTIDTIEIEEQTAETARGNIKNVGLEKNITVITGNGIDIMPELISDNKKYDIVFIDAAKGKYMIFLEYAMKLVNKGGYIIADNVLYKGMVLGGYDEHKHRAAVNKLRMFLENVQNNDLLETKLYDIGDGVTISKVI